MYRYADCQAPPTHLYEVQFTLYPCSDSSPTLSVVVTHTEHKVQCSIVTVDQSEVAYTQFATIGGTDTPTFNTQASSDIVIRVSIYNTHALTSVPL